jgi:hypothetical protein
VSHWHLTPFITFVTLIFKENITSKYKKKEGRKKELAMTPSTYHLWGFLTWHGAFMLFLFFWPSLLLATMAVGASVLKRLWKQLPPHLPPNLTVLKVATHSFQDFWPSRRMTWLLKMFVAFSVYCKEFMNYREEQEKNHSYSYHSRIITAGSFLPFF